MPSNPHQQEQQGNPGGAIHLCVSRAWWRGMPEERQRTVPAVLLIRDNGPLSLIARRRRSGRRIAGFTVMTCTTSRWLPPVTL